MADEWVTAAVGLVGALAGSGVTLAVSYMQRADAKVDRQAQEADRRRAATVKHLAAADAFLSLSRELCRAIEALPARTLPAELGDPESPLAGLHRQYVEAWNALEVSLGEVQLTLSETERIAAARLVDEAGGWSDIIDRRWRARQWPPGEERARQAAFQARRAFIAAVSESSATPHTAPAQ